jgi:NADH dehydrogenase
MENLTFGMKNTQEAISIRNHVLLTFEKLINEKKRTDDGNWNIVIVGSGPTGVELAGAFAEMKKDILPRDYPNMSFNDLKIILVSSTEKPLNVMSPEAQDKSEQYLKQLGVHFLSGKRVVDYDGDKVTLDTGEFIPSNNVIWAAGVSGNIIKGISDDKVSKNRYIVDRFNRIKGYDNIFAIGDMAQIKNKKGEIMPPNVTIARISGTTAGKNVLSMIAGKSMIKSNPKLDGILIALGGKYAAGDIFGILTVKGRIAYEIKKYVFSSYRKPLLKLIKIGYNKLKRL